MISETEFFFVASQKRLADGCTPFMRERFQTQSEAMQTALEWARKSEHGGKYYVYKVKAVGIAQREAPPVSYTVLPLRGPRSASR